MYIEDYFQNLFATVLVERHRQFPWFGTVEAVLEKNLVTFLAMFFAVK